MQVEIEGMVFPYISGKGRGTLKVNAEGEHRESWEFWRYFEVGKSAFVLGLLL